jgi:hypothetical protein
VCASRSASSTIKQTSGLLKGKNSATKVAEFFCLQFGLMLYRYFAAALAASSILIDFRGTF